MLWAGAPAAGLFSAFGDQIRWGLVGLGAPRGQTRGSPAGSPVQRLTLRASFAGERLPVSARSRWWAWQATAQFREEPF